MPKVGFVAYGNDWVWLGGRYYLQHIIRSLETVRRSADIEVSDVWWLQGPHEDPFSEVRSIIGEPTVVRLPKSLAGRFSRKARRALTGESTAVDLFRNAGIDVCFPRPLCENSGVPYIFWLPDFQHVRRPDLLSPEKVDWYRRYFDLHVEATAQIVLSSDDAKRDFEKAYPGAVNRAHVVSFCSVPDDSWWSADPVEVRMKYGVPSKFFMLCNQLTRHKNHEVIVEALRVLGQSGHRDIHVVCTGSFFDHRGEEYVSEIRKLLEKFQLQGRFHLLGLIPRSDQIALLRQSVCLLQPSLFEGWSTIVEDAKTLGKSVIASDLPVHYEQTTALVQRHWLVDPTDALTWANAMLECWSLNSFGVDEMAEARGRRHLEFAMTKCGNAFVGAIQAVF